MVLCLVVLLEHISIHGLWFRLLLHDPLPSLKCANTNVNFRIEFGPAPSKKVDFFCSPLV